MGRRKKASKLTKPKQSGTYNVPEKTTPVSCVPSTSESLTTNIPQYVPRLILEHVTKKDPEYQNWIKHTVVPEVTKDLQTQQEANQKLVDNNHRKQQVRKSRQKRQGNKLLQEEAKKLPNNLQEEAKKLSSKLQEEAKKLPNNLQEEAKELPNKTQENQQDRSEICLYDDDDVYSDHQRYLINSIPSPETFKEYKQVSLNIYSICKNIWEQFPQPVKQLWQQHATLMLTYFITVRTGSVSQNDLEVLKNVYDIINKHLKKTALLSSIKNQHNQVITKEPFTQIANPQIRGSIFDLIVTEHMLVMQVIEIFNQQNNATDEYPDYLCKDFVKISIYLSLFAINPERINTDGTILYLQNLINLLQQILCSYSTAIVDKNEICLAKAPYHTYYPLLHTFLSTLQSLYRSRQPLSNPKNIINISLNVTQFHHNIKNTQNSDNPSFQDGTGIPCSNLIFQYIYKKISLKSFNPNDPDILYNRYICVFMTNKILEAHDQLCKISETNHDTNHKIYKKIIKYSYILFYISSTNTTDTLDIFDIVVAKFLYYYMHDLYNMQINPNSSYLDCATQLTQDKIPDKIILYFLSSFHNITYNSDKRICSMTPAYVNINPLTYLCTSLLIDITKRYDMQPQILEDSSIHNHDIDRSREIYTMLAVIKMLKHYKHKNFYSGFPEIKVNEIKSGISVYVQEPISTNHTSSDTLLLSLLYTFADIINTKAQSYDKTKLITYLKNAYTSIKIPESQTKLRHKDNDVIFTYCYAILSFITKKETQPVYHYSGDGMLLLALRTKYKFPAFTLYNYFSQYIALNPQDNTICISIDVLERGNKIPFIACCFRAFLSAYNDKIFDFAKFLSEVERLYDNQKEIDDHILQEWHNNIASHTNSETCPEQRLSHWYQIKSPDKIYRLYKDVILAEHKLNNLNNAYSADQAIEISQQQKILDNLNQYIKRTQSEQSLLSQESRDKNTKNHNKQIKTLKKLDQKIQSYETQISSLTENQDTEKLLQKHQDLMNLNQKTTQDIKKLESELQQLQSQEKQLHLRVQEQDRTIQDQQKELNKLQHHTMQNIKACNDQEEKQKVLKNQMREAEQEHKKNISSYKQILASTKQTIDSDPTSYLQESVATQHQHLREKI
ncbi:MAG: hypothetical protein P857_132 [Candidatus Xenolissoclinum pacificiensis L6]|uniref:Uncharacterized protein n=1 Tax=Candidatus Xenolissoclinum pacificiensis L6 TaxID=1401685 RepID=W2V077_9RICK|nr:MAG: hypothetical protein P857_132 [Candidatus Xenolissoclinum pacificiensis L6]